MRQGLVDRILASSHFIDRPPVCVDIGASGSLPADWKALASYSICVAFDADTRDFRIEDSANGEWKRLLKLNRLVAVEAAEEVDFYLTRSPHCSSVLEPDTRSLAPWVFSELFEVERRIALPAVSLRDTLRELGITQVDWLKTDSQGTDLRLMASLGPSVVDRIIVADFEPGIIDAYKGEDKLHALMAYMSERPFFVSDMAVKGSQRISKAAFDLLPPEERDLAGATLKLSPGWAEISYLNTFAPDARHTARDLLLGWLFSSVKEQHGHAIAIADRGIRDFADPLFEECRLESLRNIRGPYTRRILHEARGATSKLQYYGRRVLARLGYT